VSRRPVSSSGGRKPCRRDLSADSGPVSIDQYYLPSWNVTIVCLILFVGISNLAYIILRYRLKLPGASQMAFDQIKWIRESTIVKHELDTCLSPK
jgi:hypothetical protein